jgi:hypothetical protein
MMVKKAIRQVREERYEVVVAGGGPAGIAAALESARTGARTALIERYGSLGGNLTEGCVGPMMGDVAGGGMVEEIEAAIGTSVNREHAKAYFIRTLTDAGVDVFLQTMVLDAEVSDGRITAVLTQGKGGLARFIAALYVDATGDGDLAYFAGCPYDMGRDGDGLVQPVSLMFVIGGIDPEQTLICQHEEHHTLLSNGLDYLQMCKDACAAGELPPSINIVRLYAMARPDERMVNATQANRIRPLDDRDIRRAEYELRTQIEQVVTFLRRRVPGFEQIYVVDGASTLGVRESRRIRGDYILRAEDLIAGKKFPDAAVHNANFSIDIHNPDGAGQSETEGLPHQAKPYDIPFGCMRPLGIQNLFTAGRCISGTHRAHASYRVMRICIAMGQAVGASAALAALEGKTTRELDIPMVQRHLMAHGVNLFD